MTRLLGCTTPFVRNKTNICVDPDKAKKALEIQSDIFDGDSSILGNACPKSCLHVKSSFGRQESYDRENDENYVPGALKIYCQHDIKVSKSYWSYSGLSLLAEVGGYVGLFLGISVQQVSNVLEKLLMYY